MSIEFLLTALVVVLMPGAGVLYTMAAGLSSGARASALAAFGCTLGILPHMIAAITGLAALLHQSAMAFQILKYFGVGYLLYMAWSTVRERGALAVSAERAPRPARTVVASGVLVNLLNPKLSIFFLAFLPQFVDTGRSGAVGQMVELSLVFMLLTLVIFVGYGRFAAVIRHRVVARPRVMTWMRRTIAGALVALGARLAFAER